MTSALSKRAQVTDWIAARVEAGDLAPGDRVPSGQALAGQFGCSAGTARQGVRVLVDRGVLQLHESARLGAVVAVDGHDSRPPRIRVADILRLRIRNGEIREGQRLLTVRALAADLGFTPESVRLALHLLHAEGVIVLTRRGSTVTDDALKILAAQRDEDVRR